MFTLWSSLKGIGGDTDQPQKRSLPRVSGQDDQVSLTIQDSGGPERQQEDPRDLEHARSCHLGIDYNGSVFVVLLT